MADNKSTQKFLPIKEIRDGVVILNNGSIKTILLASSLNFALKSAEEQQSVLSQFQNFLNSFSFPVQFFIQSRRLDIRPYILTLEERHQKQTDELMKLQIKEYIKFVKEFTTDADVMSKNFFVVVGYQPPVFDTSKGIVGRLFNKKTSKKDTAKDIRRIVKKAQESLDEPIRYVMAMENQDEANHIVSKVVSEVSNQDSQKASEI